LLEAQNSLYRILKILYQLKEQIAKKKAKLQKYL